MATEFNDDEKTCTSTETTIYTPRTSLDGTTMSEAVPDLDSLELAPIPGKLYRIKQLHSQNYINLLYGDITLATLAAPGSKEWMCEQVAGTKDWIGFRNLVSGELLGRDGDLKLICEAKKLAGWEHFRVQKRPEGGFILVMSHWGHPHPIGYKSFGSEYDANAQSLGVLGTLYVVEGYTSEEMIWEFVPV